MKHRYYLLTLFTFIISALKCTSNPFFDDDKNTYDRHTINGTVTLQDDHAPEGVYVWMEDINLQTFTSASGGFSLTLPNTPAYQGLNGAYKIYFYLGNYGYTTVTTVIRNGLFEYGERDISGNGSVRNLSPLSELVSITTRVLNENLFFNYADSLRIEVILRKDSSSPVTAKLYRDNRNIMTGFFIRKIGTTKTESLLLAQDSYRPVFESVGNQTILRSYLLWNGMRLNPGFATLTEGEYEIFPYIFLEQDGVPAELIFSFGPAATNLSEDYLNIPFIQTTDTFVVNAD